MNVRRKSMVPELCKFVKSAIMHRTFSPALRTSGKGIDYSGFKNFDVGSVIEGELGKLRKAAETHINNAITEWTEMKVNEPESPIYGWSSALVERSCLHHGLAAGAADVLEAAAGASAPLCLEVVVLASRAFPAAVRELK